MFRMLSIYSDFCCCSDVYLSVACKLRLALNTQIYSAIHWLLYDVFLCNIYIFLHHQRLNVPFPSKNSMTKMLVWVLSITLYILALISRSHCTYMVTNILNMYIVYMKFINTIDKLSAMIVPQLRYIIFIYETTGSQSPYSDLLMQVGSIQAETKFSFPTLTIKKIIFAIIFDSPSLIAVKCEYITKSAINRRNYD